MGLGHAGEMHLAQAPPCCVKTLASVLGCRSRTHPPELAGHSPALGEAVSSAGQGGSEENPILSVVIFACEGNCHQLPPGPPCSAAMQLERQRADGLAGPDSSQIAWKVWEEARSRMYGEGSWSHNLLPSLWCSAQRETGVSRCPPESLCGLHRAP